MVANNAQMKPPAMNAGRQDGDYVVFDDVPIFDEHTGEDGVVYDRALLTAIANNCNRRIQDTGDWCPLIIGHTADPDEFQGVPPDPQVVGFAGPFRVAPYGNLKPRWCIYASFWLYAALRRIWQYKQRKSVEIWPESSPERRYFDPIALLGSETPKRDLGLTYGKERRRFASHSRLFYPRGVAVQQGVLRYSRSAQPVQRYEAAAPGGSNTFLPGGPTKKRPNQYQQEASKMPFSPEDIQQLVQALKPEVQAMIDETVGNPGATVGDDLGAPPPPVAPGGADPLGAPDPLAAGAPPVPPPGGAAMQPPPAAPVTPPAPGASGPPPAMLDAPGDDEDKDKFGMHCARRFSKYAKANDETGAASFFGTLDDNEHKYARRYMKDLADDNEDAPGKALYSKLGGTFDDVAEIGSVQERYQKATVARDRYKSDAMKYRKERDELRQKYEKETAAHKVTAAKAWEETRRAELLEQQNKGIVLDVKQELEDTVDYTPDQFKAHTAKMETTYTRVPLHGLPVEESRALEPLQHVKEAAQYSDRAAQVAQKNQKAGRKANYTPILRKLVETGGKATDDELAALPIAP